MFEVRCIDFVFFAFDFIQHASFDFHEFFRVLSICFIDKTEARRTVQIDGTKFSIVMIWSPLVYRFQLYFYDSINLIVSSVANRTIRDNAD